MKLLLYMIYKRNEYEKYTAANGRFGVMAAVTPQTWQCKFETLYPAGSFVGAAAAPSRWDVIGKRRTAQPTTDNG